MPSVDHAVLEAAKSGHREAFAEIVRGHFRSAFATALAIVQDPVDAEDVVQDAFVRSWQRLGQCRDAASFGSWLRRIVQSVAYNHLERERVRAAEPIRSDTPATSGTPEGTLEQTLLRERLTTAMRGLTEMQREVLLLYDLEGFRHAEVARLLGTSEMMSRQHLTNARRRMRRALSAPERRTVNE